MKKFDVCAVGFNADQFRENYKNYISAEYEDDFENVIFTLNAPQSIYDEIDDMKEECIEIMNNE